jgi:hypothetical protein
LRGVVFRGTEDQASIRWPVQKLLEKTRYA